MDPGYGRDEFQVTRYCALQAAFLKRGVRNLRVMGSTGLVMAPVAAGRFDAALEEGSWTTGLGPKIWDFAAGKLLVEEAGGLTRDLEEEQGDLLATADRAPLDLEKRSFFCASTPELAEELLTIVAMAR